jgi:hypothetical protein
VFFQVLQAARWNLQGRISHDRLLSSRCSPDCPDCP